MRFLLFALLPLLACCATKAKPSLVSSQPPVRESAGEETMKTLTDDYARLEAEVRGLREEWKKLVDTLDAEIKVATAKSRDHSRLRAANYIQAMMRWFYLGALRYPVSLAEFVKTFKYGEIVEPADGSCQPEDNAFGYKQTNEGKSYEVRFCLGAETEGYAAGVHILTPEGIK